MDLLRKVEAAARKVGSSDQVRAGLERLGVKQGRYEAVEKEEEAGGGGGAGAFTIDDEDGDELNMCVSPAPPTHTPCQPAHVGAASVRGCCVRRRREKLSRMHTQLVEAAHNSINSTESQVMSLRAERQEHERAVRELSMVNDAARGAAVPSALDEIGNTQRTPCCRGRCVIL